MSELVAFGTIFGIGYLLGMLRSDDKLWKLRQQQQDRGDYWFDKYQRAVQGPWWQSGHCRDDESDFSS